MKRSLASYELVYTKRARDDIKKLDPVVKKRLGKTIQRFRLSPIYYGRRLKGTQVVGEFRWRIGDYRVIFDISGREIIILRVGHRRDIYER